MGKRVKTAAAGLGISLHRVKGAESIFDIPTHFVMRCTTYASMLEYIRYHLSVLLITNTRVIRVSRYTFLFLISTNKVLELKTPLFSILLYNSIDALFRYFTYTIN